MINLRQIMEKVRGMRSIELLELILKNPHFLTDAYFSEIGKAIRARYEELKTFNGTRR